MKTILTDLILSKVRWFMYYKSASYSHIYSTLKSRIINVLLWRIASYLFSSSGITIIDKKCTLKSIRVHSYSYTNDDTLPKKKDDQENHDFVKLILNPPTLHSQLLNITQITYAWVRKRWSQEGVKVMYNSVHCYTRTITDTQLIIMYCKKAQSCRIAYHDGNWRARMNSVRHLSFSPDRDEDG